ncbi:MAG: DUF6943 family protein, partial [Empedobacter falsenii]
LDVYRSLLFGLWKTKAFHQLLVGSVIPFIRINDFKNLILEQINYVKGKEQVFTNDIQKVKTLE